MNRCIAQTWVCDRDHTAVVVRGCLMYLFTRPSYQRRRYSNNLGRNGAIGGGSCWNRVTLGLLQVFHNGTVHPPPRCNKQDYVTVGGQISDFLARFSPNVLGLL